MNRRFRRARSEEADFLNEMTLAGLRHWGHHQNHPEAYNGLASQLPGREDTAAHLVFVLEEGEEVVGFYELRDRGNHFELLRMFQKVELIGQGYGRLLWDHAVSEARKQSDKMLIMSDPGAVGFYEAMGAELSRTEEVAPGFVLSVFWYQLGEQS